MKARMKKLVSLVLASAMTVSFPFAGGMGFDAVAYAAEAGEPDGPDFGAGG